MSEEIPKLDLLIKLMGMTGSSSDGEALVALRKATAHIQLHGWTWETLLRNKVKVVESPFLGQSNPFERKVSAAPSYTPPSAPPKPAGPSFWTASPTAPISTVRNRFPDHCYCCGEPDILPSKGWLFDPWNFVPSATSKWRVACDACNTTGTIRAFSAAPRRTKRGKASVSDLA